ncbi:DUF5666 domain-containing protein [Candidatus Halobeggiatoa sp. HSG11]|nr:DUF5666 domain-containing protein [Candidatus Halobeggiatoa sp. HSG11]
MNLNIFKPYNQIFKICLVLSLLIACDSETINIVEGGLEGTGTGTEKGTNVGPISDFGSIIVNDITYDTNQSEIFINGESSNFEQLSLGMQITVDSTQESERDIAEQISYQDSLRGPVLFISPTGNSLRIAGQTIIITEQTVLHGFEQVVELRLGDYLRVSGPSAGARGIQATLLERLPPVPEILLTGTIVHLDAANQTFFISNNGLLISYSEVQMLSAELHNGQLVEVIGTVDKKVLQATQIRTLDVNILPPRTSFILNGTVTRFVSSNDFEVEHRSIHISPDTRVIKGSLEDVGLGSQVKVYGSVNEDGILILDSISVNTVSNSSTFMPMRLSGPLDNIELQNQNLTIFGVSVQLLPNILFRDVSGQFEHFGPQEFRIGDVFAVAGSANPNGGITAETIQYEPFAPFNHRQLQGPPTDIDGFNGTWHIFGVTVLTDDNTEFFDTLDNPPNLPPPGSPLIVSQDSITDATKFFARISPDVLVHVNGEWQGNVLLAKVVVLVYRLGE